MCFWLLILVHSSDSQSIILYPVQCCTRAHYWRNEIKKMSIVNTAVQHSTLLELKSKVSLKSLTVKCTIYLITDSQERSLKKTELVIFTIKREYQEPTPLLSIACKTLAWYCRWCVKYSTLRLDTSYSRLSPVSCLQFHKPVPVSTSWQVTFSLLVDMCVLECSLPTDNWLKVASCEDDTWEDRPVLWNKHLVDIFTFIIIQIGPWLLKSKPDDAGTW